MGVIVSFKLATGDPLGTRDVMFDAVGTPVDRGIPVVSEFGFLGRPVPLYGGVVPADGEGEIVIFTVVVVVVLVPGSVIVVVLLILSVIVVGPFGPDEVNVVSLLPEVILNGGVV